MDKNLPEPHSSEEVDLGNLVKLISRLINSFFGFLGDILNKLFLAVVWVVFFVKKHSLKIFISGALGIAYGVYIEKTSDPVYKSNITIRQNYEIGKDLYNSIDYFNDLLSQDDTLQLGNILDISPKQASVILNFDIQYVVSEKERLTLFNDYLKTLDSTLASNVVYEDFFAKYTESDYEFQKITITAKEKNNFNLVFKKIVELSNANQYFLSEQKKDLLELESKKKSLQQALASSQELQSTYMRVLENGLERKGTEIGITLEGGNSKAKTKEYDLFLNDIDLRRDLVKTEREKLDKEKIVEIISGKQDSGSVHNTKYIFKTGLSPKVYYAIYFIAVTFFGLVMWRIFKFLERYKSEI